MAVQTTQRANELVGLPGEVVDALPIEPITRIAEAVGNAGDLWVKGVATTRDGLSARPLSYQATATNAIIASGVGSTTGAQDIAPASYNGVVGATRLVPARNLTITLNNHANWDATTATVTGYDNAGLLITEDFSIPDAGNTTLVGAKLFSKVTNLHIPAQSGTNGVLTMGIGDLKAPITGLDALGVARKLVGMLLQNLDQTTNFLVNDVLSLIREGRIWVATEVDVKDGEQAFVRLVAGGGETVGAWTNIPDGTPATNPDCVPVTGMRYDGDTVDRDGFKMTRLRINLAS